MKAAPTVSVVCAECGRRLRGYPTVTGRYAVGRHVDKGTGKRCRGFYTPAYPVHTRDDVPA